MLPHIQNWRLDLNLRPPFQTQPLDMKLQSLPFLPPSEMAFMQTQLPSLLPTRPSCLCFHLISPTSPMFSTSSILSSISSSCPQLSSALPFPPLLPLPPPIWSLRVAVLNFRGLSYQGTCERYFRNGLSFLSEQAAPRGAWAGGLGALLSGLLVWTWALAQAVLHCSDSGQCPCALRGHHLHLGHLWLPCPAAGMGWRLSVNRKREGSLALPCGERRGNPSESPGTFPTSSAPPTDKHHPVL